MDQLELEKQSPNGSPHLDASLESTVTPKALEVIRVPYSLLDRIPEELDQYRTAVSEDVPFDATPLAAALMAVSDGDPMGAAEAETYFDFRLRPSVKEVANAWAEGWKRVEIRESRATAHNDPILVRLSALAERRESELLRIHTNEEEIRDELRTERLLLAQSAAWAKLSLSESGELESIPDQRQLRSAEAHAAELGLPYNPNESAHFIPKWLEVCLSALVGTALGASILSAAGAVRLDALGRSPGVVVVAALVGCAITLSAGTAVKLLWRHASELFYQGRNCWLGVAAAWLVTWLLILSDAVIEQKGLLANAMRQEALSALSGKAGTQPQNGGVEMFLIALVVSFGYFVLAAVVGWRRDRAGAHNRIILSQESEHLARYAELWKDPEFPSVLLSQNRIRALAVVLNDLAAVRDQSLRRFDQEEHSLTAKLLAIEDLPGEADRRLIEYQASQARGAQATFDRMWHALRERRIESFEVGKPKKLRLKGGFLSLLLSRLGLAKRAPSGGR